MSSLLGGPHAKSVRRHRSHDPGHRALFHIVLGLPTLSERQTHCWRPNNIVGRSSNIVGAVLTLFQSLQHCWRRFLIVGEICNIDTPLVAPALNVRPGKIYSDRGFFNTLERLHTRLPASSGEYVLYSSDLHRVRLILDAA